MDPLLYREQGSFSYVMHLVFEAGKVIAVNKAASGRGVRVKIEVHSKPPPAPRWSQVSQSARGAPGEMEATARGGIGGACKLSPRQIDTSVSTSWVAGK